MDINTFMHYLRICGGIKLNNCYVLFRSLCLYDLEKGADIKSFDDFRDVLSYELDGKTIREHIDILTVQDVTAIELDGRGTSKAGSDSGNDDDKEFRFSHATDGHGKDRTAPDLPARVNVKVANADKNPEAALRAFRDLHVSDDYESAIAVDAQGFVTQYVHGNAHSVRIRGRSGEMIYHNHPSGGAFSDSDLISTSLSPEKGIVASGKNGDYIFAKGSHFKAEGFVKAVRRAKLKGATYDDAVDRWLTDNQKKYGYTYHFDKK